MVDVCGGHVPALPDVYRAASAWVTGVDGLIFNQPSNRDSDHQGCLLSIMIWNVFRGISFECVIWQETRKVPGYSECRMQIGADVFYKDLTSTSCSSSCASPSSSSASSHQVTRKEQRPPQPKAKCSSPTPFLPVCVPSILPYLGTNRPSY